MTGMLRYVDPFWKLKRFFNIGCEFYGRLLPRLL